MSDDKDRFYGMVCWFDPKKGYGFIKWDKEDGIPQKDMFVHFSDVTCEGFKTLYKEQRVSFKLGVNHNGDPKAVDVLILKN
jgi:cold shock CspA family protein